MSKILSMIRRHEREIKKLQDDCKHPKDSIKLDLDHSQIGRGSSVPGISATCKECGLARIWHGVDKAYFKLNTERFRTLGDIELPDSMQTGTVSPTKTHIGSAFTGYCYLYKLDGDGI